MIPYWLFFLVPAMAAIAAGHRSQFRRDGTRNTALNAPWILALITLTVLIGFRFQVGGDWYNYFNYLRRATGATFREVISLGDPGFWIINLISVKAGWGITGVNTIGGFFFSLGLVLFCRSTPRPWLALAVAVPYTIIVVGMGYSRQSIALGFAMIGFVALGRKSFLKFVFWVLVGATFHKTAVLLIPLAALTATKNRFLIGGLILATSALAYQVLLADQTEHLLTVYTNSFQQSQGALIRLSMNAIAGLLFLFYRRKFRITRQEYLVWRLYSAMTIVMIVALFLLPISTALDRMGLYILPLQMLVFAHLPDVLGRYGARNEPMVALILLYYATVLYVWLNFGSFSKLWIPYQMQF